jgi:D-alanyl-D-alanine carboxypeptidase/D-alanyl-D-alanine-endopeptidase (penicillin-binding protein 4)
VARQFLETEVGWRHGSYVLDNGSGLNDVNRFSTEQIAQLLRYMYGHAEAGHEFVASLGVAGRQGTIALRLRDTAADRRLRAKTGTLSSVSALSGYVVTTAGEPLIFSILVNGYDGSTRPIWEVQDMIGEALAMYPGDLRDRLDATALHRSPP